jgi:hypothetical protein
MSHNIVPTAASIAADSGGGTSNFLRADGTWAAPPGGGGGITALTGDVTASGTGSVVATIAATLDTIPAPVASVDFNAQQATTFRVENRTDDTGCTQVGRIWLRTDL